jgi:hypothetical protein
MLQCLWQTRPVARAIFNRIRPTLPRRRRCIRANVKVSDLFKMMNVRWHRELQSPAGRRRAGDRKSKGAGRAEPGAE